MGNVRLYGATSGYTELAPPAVAGASVLTLPSGTGTLAKETGAWTGYTPTLTASTTNPTLGTGGSASGRYSQIGKIVFGYGALIFGTSGVAAGTGTYYVSLPVARVSNGEFPMGSIVLRDSSGGFIASIGTLQGLAGDASKAILVVDGAFAAGAGFPWAWAASDQIWYQFTYEVA